MYTPRHFANDDTQHCLALMQANSFATLVTQLDGELEATHLPMFVDTSDDAQLSIAFHVARNNPICQALNERRSILIIFTGTHGYISPDWYATPSLVPTWNYTAVHVTGQPQELDDAQLTDLLSDLTNHSEQSLPKTPWSPTSLDATSYAQMRKSIVGYRMPVATMTGKAKLNQNRSADDRAGAIKGLRELPDNQGHALATLMQAHLDSTRGDKNTS